MPKRRVLDLSQIERWFRERGTTAERLRAEAQTLRAEAEQKEAEASSAEEEVKKFLDDLSQRLRRAGTAAAEAPATRRRRAPRVTAAAPALAAAQAKGIGVIEAMIQALQEAGRPLLSGELVEAIRKIRPGTSEKVVQVMLYRLRQQDRIRRRKVRGKGRTFRYALPEGNDNHS